MGKDIYIIFVSKTNWNIIVCKEGMEAFRDSLKQRWP